MAGISVGYFFSSLSNILLASLLVLAAKTSPATTTMCFPRYLGLPIIWIMLIFLNFFIFILYLKNVFTVNFIRLRKSLPAFGGSARTLKENSSTTLRTCGAQKFFLIRLKSHHEAYSNRIAKPSEKIRRKRIRLKCLHWLRSTRPLKLSNVSNKRFWYRFISILWTMYRSR